MDGAKRYRFAGQKRGVFAVIKMEPWRRSAIEAVLGHLKADGHLARNFNKGGHGDHADAVTNFRA